MAGVVHISEEEAARDFGVVMQHIRSGDEVRLDCKDGVQAVVKRAEDEPVKARSITGIIAELKERGRALGLSVLDDEFFADVAAVQEGRKIPQSEPAFQRRTIAEAREILRLRRETQGLAVPDPDMASDMEEIHELYNQPMDMSRWD